MPTDINDNHTLFSVDFHRAPVKEISRHQERDGLQKIFITVRGTAGDGPGTWTVWCNVSTCSKIVQDKYVPFYLQLVKHVLLSKGLININRQHQQATWWDTGQQLFWATAPIKMHCSGKKQCYISRAGGKWRLKTVALMAIFSFLFFCKYYFKYILKLYY